MTSSDAHFDGFDGVCMLQRSDTSFSLFAFRNNNNGDDMLRAPLLPQNCCRFKSSFFLSLLIRYQGVGYFLRRGLIRLAYETISFLKRQDIKNAPWTNPEC